MQIKYSVSLWNYFHYADVPSLERIIRLVREQDYGIELWPLWKEENLFDEIGRRRLKYILQDMKVSLHAGEANTFDLHKKQIDAAVDFGAEVIVLHSANFLLKDKSGLDVPLTRQVVVYAADRGVRIALENGQLPFLVNAIEKVERLGICLDIGHVYFTSDPMNKFLGALKERIIHLHIQDTLPKSEDNLPHIRIKDHYMVGTGGIPDRDWERLVVVLKEINFQGIAVFEIHPRDPLQTAFLGREFMQKFLQT